MVFARTALGAFLAVFACLLTAPPVSADDVNRADSVLAFVNPVVYEITQRITVTNHDVSSLDLLELNVPIPLDWPEQQVELVNITGDRIRRLQDVEGLGMIVRSLYREPAVLPGPGQSRSLTAAYRLTRREIRANAGRLAVRAYEPYDKRSAQFRLYTRSEKLIDADAPEVKEVAAKLKAKAKTPYRFAEAAYEYVIDQTAYASPSPSQGALECLRKGKADCGSYTALFVALCRAGGIPARPVAGCWARGENQWHCWAEFLLPGVGWVSADPTAGDRGPREREYYFGNLDNNRVALAKTFNLTVNTTQGSTALGFVQVGTWWWYPAAGSSGSKMVVEHYFRGIQAVDRHRPRSARPAAPIK